MPWKIKKTAYNDCLSLGITVDITAADNIQLKFKKSDGQSRIDIDEDEEDKDTEIVEPLE